MSDIFLIDQRKRQARDDLDRHRPAPGYLSRLIRAARCAECGETWRPSFDDARRGCTARREARLTLASATTERAPATPTRTARRSPRPGSPEVEATS